MSRDIKYIGMDVHKEAVVIAVRQLAYRAAHPEPTPSKPVARHATKAVAAFGDGLNDLRLSRIIFKYLTQIRDGVLEYVVAYESVRPHRLKKLLLRGRGVRQGHKRTS